MAGFHLDDTIAAVSTAMAPAGIGIVRISGNDAFEVADRVFRAKKEGKKLSAVKSHTIHYGWITEGEEVIDEVLVMVMKGPKTYTGENTVEIDCHGGVLAVKKVLEAVLNAGARAADPGEFTKRAFLNGRMDLTQAEAVMDVISAKSAYAIGSGKLFGKGLGESLQKMGNVPESQNDMIFTIICEELGLFGAVCVILLFVLLLWRMMVIANNATDLYGALVVSGIMSHIAIQVILNIAVVTNTIPNTGVILPFISYGGTSIVFLMGEMGLALSVSKGIRLESME